jgi:hypothetical protein
MQISRFKLLFLSILLLSLAACGEKERSKGIAVSTGGTAEILVVMDEELWKGPAGESVRTILEAPVEGLPQDEPLFDIIRINPAGFRDDFLLHHNILVVQSTDTVPSAVVETQLDYWASPQRLVRVAGPHPDSLSRAILSRGENIASLFRESDYRRLQKLFTELQDVKVSTTLRKTIGLGLTVPGGFYTAKLTENFAWLRKETKDFSQGLIIYFTPYEDTSYFSQKLIINRRDQMCMIYIPGEREGSYMRTAGSIPPVSKNFDFKGRFAVETRGLWDVAGDFMGGPFINYAILDEKNNRIISLDAYVYYPNSDKRDLLLQMEAMMQTLDFQEP